MNNSSLKSLFSGKAFCVWMVFLLPALALSAERTGGSGILALKGARVHTAAGPPIDQAVILIENGRILAVGRDVAVPAGAEVIDVTGREIIPGLLDEHSHIGAYYRGVNEFPQPIGPENRAFDSVYNAVEEWYEACKGGVTTVVTGPGSGERMSGQSVTMKTYGKDWDKRFLKKTGEAKWAINARWLNQVTSIREELIKAKEYMEKWEIYEAGGKKGQAPERDLALETLVPVLKGKEKIRCHLHYANDVMTMLKLRDEFKLDLTFIHTTEAWKVAPEIAARNVPVIVLPFYTRMGVSDYQIFGIKSLYDAGVKVCLHTDHPVVLQRVQRLNAGMVIRYGVPEEAALRMVTMNPAESSKIADRVGSIEPGKDADLVVLNGVWYEPRTRVDMVFVDGVPAYDRLKNEPCRKEKS